MDDDDMEHGPAQTGTSVHRRAWDAIPWVAAGAASADETRQLHEHLPHCAECRAEWALLRRVGHALQAGAPADDPQAAWQRMAARLETADTAATTDAMAASAAAAVPGAVARPAFAGTWTRWLVAAVVVQAVGLGAAGLALHDRQRAADRDGEYRTLSTPAAAPAAASLRLVPAPQMPFGALQPLLARHGLVAVEIGEDGASLGLAAADGNPRRIEAALPQLRATPGVLLAEPLAPAAR